MLRYGKSGRSWLAATILAVTAVSAMAAVQKDELQVKINGESPSIQSLAEGGANLVQGAYSTSSAIKVNYNLVASSFPAAVTQFGTFKLGLAIKDNGDDTVYPLTVGIAQPGANQSLRLSASPSSFAPSNASSTSDSTVTMTIDCTVPGGCPTADGSTITANLQFTGPTGTNGLKTEVKVQVNITLVIPKSECGLNLYDFLTDQTLISPATSTEVGYVKKGANAGKVTATTPFGQFSDNVMVANTCAGDNGAKSFDLAIELDPSFDTNPNDNPGNAVFTYKTSEIVDPESFNIEAFGTGSPQGQTLCLQSVTLAGESSFLATVHMGIKRGILYTYLDSEGKFNFKATLFQAGSGCGAEMGDTAEAKLPYTLK